MRTNILKWATLAACLHGTLAVAGAGSAQDYAELHVWHALNGSPEQAFVELVDEYQGNSGNDVVVSQFSSQEELYSALQVAHQSGQQLPDVVLGNHTMAPELTEAGLLTAYCVPGECPECESDNPPGWCAYASGGYYGDYNGDFAASMIPELAMTADRCLEDGCAECERPGIFRPPYCDYVMVSGGQQLDLFQAAFAVYHPEFNIPFKNGIPGWVEIQAVLANRVRLEQYGIEKITDVAQAQELISFNNALWLANFDGEFCGTPPRRWGVPGWASDVWSPQDPIPASEADVLIAPSSELAPLLDEMPDLEVAVMEDHRPEAIVHGAFMLATTEHRSAALDFMYGMASPEFQLNATQGTTFLPAHGEAFNVTDGAVTGLRDAMLTSGLAPTYIQ